MLVVAVVTGITVSTMFNQLQVRYVRGRHSTTWTHAYCARVPSVAQRNISWRGVKHDVSTGTPLPVAHADLPLLGPVSQIRKIRVCLFSLPYQLD